VYVPKDAAAASTGTQTFKHKSYMPPTPMNADAANPFGSVLDAPLG
jgi:hypothetical protein